MSKILSLAAVVVVGLCSFFVMSRVGLGAIVTTPSQFSSLLSDADYGKVVGRTAVCEDLFKRGIDLLSQRSFKEAAECFWRVIDDYSSSSALRANPHVASAYY